MRRLSSVKRITGAGVSFLICALMFQQKMQLKKKKKKEREALGDKVSLSFCIALIVAIVSQIENYGLL